MKLAASLLITSVLYDRQLGGGSVKIGSRISLLNGVTTGVLERLSHSTGTGNVLGIQQKTKADPDPTDLGIRMQKAYEAEHRKDIQDSFLNSYIEQGLAVRDIKELPLSIHRSV